MGMVESKEVDSSHIKPPLHSVGSYLPSFCGHVGHLDLISLVLMFSLVFPRFGDVKLQNPENKAFAQMFQKNYAGKILECHLNLLNVIRVGGYLPDRVINLILQYLSNRFVK